MNNKVPSKLSQSPLIHDEKAHRIDRIKHYISTLMKAIVRIPKHPSNDARIEQIGKLRRELGELDN